MPNIKNGVTWSCNRCGTPFYLIKSRIGKSKEHYCSRSCVSIVSAGKRKKYPLKIGDCKYCYKPIIATSSEFNKPGRKFCTYSCRTAWRNSNTPKTIGQIMSIQKTGKAWKNKKRSVENRLKMRELNLGQGSHFWRGGLTSENRKLRNSSMKRIWREKVFERDNYICQFCRKRGGILNADHIKSWSLHPELRFDINNGRTLCLECHKKTDNFGYKGSVIRQNYKS